MALLSLFYKPVKRGLFCILLAAIFSGSLALLAGPSSGVGRKPTEIEVKAAFLLNFAHFTKWPSSAFTSSNSPFHIVIVGEDPFGSHLDEILAGEKVQGHPFSLSRVESTEKIPERCHLLFVGTSERREVPSILDQLAGKPVLTVGDFSPFCEMGGCVRFRLKGNRVGIVVNPGALKMASLKMDSELLEIAELKETRP